MSNIPYWNSISETGLKLVKTDNEFQFDCTNCGECCRNVKNAVMLESLDMFRIAKHTGRAIEELITEIATPVLLAWGYPILTLKTKAHRDSCVFLKNHKCSIHDAKPRACRTYPMVVGPDDSKKQPLLTAMDVTRHNHHFQGQTHTTKDWLDKNLTEEDRQFLHTDFNFAVEYAKLMDKFDKSREEEVMQNMIMFRYIMFDLNSDFNKQFVWNMACLKKKLEACCK